MNVTLAGGSSDAFEDVANNSSWSSFEPASMSLTSRFTIVAVSSSQTTGEAVEVVIRGVVTILSDHPPAIEPASFGVSSIT